MHPPELALCLQRSAENFRQQLLASSAAISYLKNREIRGEIAGRMGLGYAPSGARFLSSVFTDDESDLLLAAGLVVDGKSGRYDRFRDRIMFPIANDVGQIVGFGGRVIDADGPKYLNSPESEFFKKRELLYGLHLAKPEIERLDSVLVVEGYFDVISLHQHDIQHAVATLGTSLTEVHAEKLLGFAHQMMLCFDGDEAGCRAAERAMEVCWPLINDTHSVQVLLLPSGHDPDSYVRTFGADGFKRLLDKALPLEQFWLQVHSRSCRLDQIEGRARLAAMAEPYLRKSRSPRLLFAMLEQISGASGLSTGEILEVCDLV
jgi:DNA primase